MDTLIQANIFFFITSLAVIVISIGVLLLVLKIRRLVISLNELVERLKSTTDYVGDEAKDLMEDIKQSGIFRMFFPKRRKKTQSTYPKDNPQKTTRRKV